MKDYAVIFLGAWRTRKQLSLEELSRRAKLEQSLLVDLEASQADYSPEIISCLAKGLGIEPFRLFVHPSVNFEEVGTFMGVDAQMTSTMLSLFIPDLVEKLQSEGKLEDLSNGLLPEEYWQVQSEKLFDLMKFLRSCREDQPAALRSLFESLESDSHHLHMFD